MNTRKLAEQGEGAQVQALRARCDTLEKMVNVSRLLSSTLNLDRLLRIIIRTAEDLLDSEAASILLEDRRTGGLQFAAATGSSAEELRRLEVPIEGSIAGTVFRSGKSLIVDNVNADPRHYVEVDRQAQFETRSILGVPMRLHGSTIGVLEAINKLDGTFDDGDAAILRILASQAAIAIHNARLVSDLRAANERLSEIDKLKSDFISIASHELRTPLGIVLGYAALLQEDVSGNLGDAAKGLYRGATQLRSVIESMTNLNFLQSEGLQLDLETVTLQDVLVEACDNWQLLAQGKGQQLLQRFPDAPVCVEVDPLRVMTVLDVLLDNAVKFTPSGGVIEVTIRPQTGRVAVCVTDNGVSIPRDELERIFEPFYQVEEHMTRKYGGLGLGLTIAQRIVQLHGGSIWAENLPQRGSRFTFCLPIMWEEAVGGCGKPAR
ncbi:MAG: ATP-binding protein [Anaerolineae bacterium]